MSSKQVRSSTEEDCLSKTRMVTSLDDVQSLRFWKAVGAEFLGTLLLVLIGCGSCIPVGDNKPTVVAIALCFGLSVATIVWAIGHISGGHINPAVTAAMLATRKISLARAGFYILFQLLGAIVGAGLLFGLTVVGSRESSGKENGTEKIYLGVTSVNPESGIGPGKAVGIEIFITFVLVFTVFSSVDSKRKDLNGSTPLTIGLSITMCHLFAVPFTGSSMNTARSFGPAVVVGSWADHWVYWVGPLIGGVAGGLVYDHVFAVNASLTKAKACVLTSAYDDEKYEAQKVRIRILEEAMDEAETAKLKEAEVELDDKKQDGADAPTPV